jgi:hypothetical protein
VWLVETATNEEIVKLPRGDGAVGDLEVLDAVVADALVFELIAGGVEMVGM